MNTGGLTEIRVQNNNAYAAYAFFLKNFREELFSRSVKWSFPLDSFLSELDSLVKFYVNVLSLIASNCVMAQDKAVLDEQLMKPLSLFFKSVDKEFGINYFDSRIDEFKAEPSNIVWINENLEEALDRMEAANQKRKFRRQEKSPLKKLAYALKPEKYGETTMTYGNKFHYRFIVPTKIYQETEYREKLDNARTMEEVESIIKGYHKHN